MRNSVILPLSLLTASALAIPHVNHHHHQRRDTTSIWTKGNEVYIEDIHMVTVVPGSAQAPPSTPTHPSSAAAKADEKIAYPEGQPGHNHSQHDFQDSSSSASPYLYSSPATHPVKTATPAAAVISSPKPEITEATGSSATQVISSPASKITTSSAAQVGSDSGSSTGTQVISSSASKITEVTTSSAAQAGSGSGSSTGTGPVPGPSNINTAGSPAWSSSPNSMGKSIIGTADYWRKTWNSTLGSFEWNIRLAANARSTAIDPIVTVTNSDGTTSTQNEGGANQMNHKLNPGSMAQCINEGDGTTMDSGLTPFEQAWLGWLCERPNSNIPCDKISETGHYAIDKTTGKQETGHADIIGGGYTQIGCYYQDGTEKPAFVGMWTCDFA